MRASSSVELVDDRISRLRTYFHAPETLEELCRELQVPFRASGYRSWW